MARRTIPEKTERRIANMLASGKSSPEIADACGVAVGTVERRRRKKKKKKPYTPKRGGRRRTTAPAGNTTTSGSNGSIRVVDVKSPPSIDTLILDMEQMVGVRFTRDELLERAVPLLYEDFRRRMADAIK